jgi:hypothetical protein
MLDVERCPTPPKDDEVCPNIDGDGGVNPEPVPPPPLVMMEVFVLPALLLVPPNVGPIVSPGPENVSDFVFVSYPLVIIGIDPLIDVEEDCPTLPPNDDDVTCSLPNLLSSPEAVLLSCICSCPPRSRDPLVESLLLPLLLLLLSKIVLEYRSSRDTDTIGDAGMEEVE